MDRKLLIEQIQSYETSFEEEEYFVPRFLSFLRNFPDCFLRTQTTGHMTASAWIMSHCASKVLLLHHTKLGKWLQPGGHADGDENLLRVARKEAEEETGLKTISLVHPQFFDMDIHRIPGHKNIKEHQHFDIRFLFVADDNEPLGKNDEAMELKWLHLEEVANYTNNNRSIHRMILKAKLIFNSDN